MSLLIVSGIVFVVMLYRIRREKRRFSNAIMLLLFLGLFILGISELLKVYFPPMEYIGEGKYVMTEAGTIRIYLRFLIQFFILAGGILLIVNGYQLLKRERKCLAHFLPILFGVLCIVFIVFYYVDLFYGISRVQEVFFRKILLRTLFYGVLYIPFVLTAYVLYSYIYKFMVRDKTCDYIIVLGAKIIGKKVSPLLAGRLDKGLAIYRQLD